MMKTTPEQPQSPHSAGDVPTAEMLHATVSAILQRVAQQIADQLLADSQTPHAAAESPRRP